MSADAPEFLPTDPPHWAARGLSAILIALFVAAVLVFALLRVPETVESPFLLVPQRGADPVRALQDGVVMQVRVSEGQSVQAGEALFVVRSHPTGDRAAELGALQAQLAGAGQSLDNAEQQQRSETLADADERRRLQGRIADLEGLAALKSQQMVLAQELLAKQQALQGGGYGSREQIIRQQLEVHRLEVELAQTRTDRHEARAALDKLGHDAEARALAHRERVRRLRETRDTTAIRADSLQQDPLQSGTGALSLTAPCTGTVIRQPLKAAGAVVLEGDVLCELACAGEQLQAELRVPAAEAGRLRTGQGVKLMYDAFPYQRYGVRYASLRWLSPAADSRAQGGGFRALAELAEQEIAAADGARPLRAGMGGTARIVIGRRSLLSHAFEPVRQLREQLAMPPPAPAPAP